MLTKHLYTLIKFRCGNHKLPIVQGRYENKPREERVCQYCLKNDMNTIGDEFHYIMKCPQFQDARNKYIDDKYTINPDHNKFKLLFQSKSQKTLIRLSKLCKIIMTHLLHKL
jgi:hypothetical protein